MSVHGNVSDDEWSEHVANGEAFIGEALEPASGGMIAHAQIRNPPGSLKRIRLRMLVPMPIFGIAINTNIRRYDPALATLAPFAPPMNLMGSGGAAVAELRNDSLLVAVGSPFHLILSAGSARKNYPPLNLDWGHDLLPGEGLVLQSAVGGFILVGFMWVEVLL